jgi:DNA-binding NarL/FixJ family response regulator
MSFSLDNRTAVLVDQHPLWLETVEQVLRRVGVTVLAKITSAQEALERIDELRPDLLTTGIEMPAGAMDGITLVSSARERVPGLRVVVLSQYDDAEHVDAALAAGARAYVLKTAHPEDLASAVRQAFRHSIFLASSRPIGTLRLIRAGDGSADLTRRELEILKLVAEGMSNAQLAHKLWVTEQTVKFHLSNIYRKLNVANRTEASRWAQLHGLLPAPSLDAAA